MRKFLILITLLTLLACTKAKKQEIINIQALRDITITEANNCIYVKSLTPNKYVINCSIDRIESIYGFTEVESASDSEVTLIVYPQEIELNNSMVNISYIKIKGAD